MAYRMQLSVGSGSVNPWAVAPTAAVPAAAVPTAGAGACSTAYGPVANICQSSMPVTTMVPVTTVTPIPNTVMPQSMVGQPMAAAPYGKGAMAPYGKGAMPLGFAPGISTMGKTMSPWGVSTQGTTGFAPGLYTQEVSIPW
ncbi:MAG TPA: hypothetical protein VNT75_17495 [Symbiobacteriaceae bacterium]|nr:hypothetical protein [Symbiobacteriaceae bacterium]